MGSKGAGKHGMSCMSRLAAHKTVLLHGTMAAEGVPSAQTSANWFKAEASCRRAYCSCRLLWVFGRQLTGSLCEPCLPKQSCSGYCSGPAPGLSVCLKLSMSCCKEQAAFGVNRNVLQCPEQLAASSETPADPCATQLLTMLNACRMVAGPWQQCNCAAGSLPGYRVPPLRLPAPMGGSKAEE